MKAGIKVGPEKWRERLDFSRQAPVEVWFRLDWQEKYLTLFEYLQKQKIQFGLHYWAMIKGKYLPSLLYEQKGLVEENFEFIKKTIMIASRHQARYVNFHPDCYCLTEMDLNRSTIKTIDIDKPVNKEKAYSQLVYYLEKIQLFGQKKGVEALIETVPKNSPGDFKNFTIGRLNPQLSEGLGIEKIYQLAKLGFPICFDIEHTMSQLISRDKEEIFAFVYEAAKKLLDNIKLVHVSTKVPPFNGTDCHNGILPEDFNQPNVLPNKEQLIKILSLFKDKDIWLIPEPRDKMVENHVTLQKIVKSII